MEKYSEQVDFEKNNPEEQISSTLSEEKDMILSSNTKIRGWLWFFLFMLGANALTDLISTFGYFSILYPYNIFLAFLSLFMGFFISGWTAYTVSFFVKRERNAVFLAKCNLFIYLYIRLLSELVINVEIDKMESIVTVVTILIWYTLWFCFLHYSKQVKEMFPKSLRKPFTRDYYLMGFFIVTTLILLTLSILDTLR